MNNRDIRNNPTANRSLRNIETKYSPIKSSINDLKDLNILCTRCTIFEKDSALKDELYRCPQCNNVHSDNQIKYAMRLELPEYIYYDKTKPIKDIKKQREEEEKFIIQPINMQSPSDLMNKIGARTVKTNRDTNNNKRPSSTDQ
jgi:hypothetical protein